MRIEYPDAWYHVMNRGRRGEPIFLQREDYLTFIERLKETAAMWNLKVGAYCLMPNHYHLLIQTPDANLSRCMRHVNKEQCSRKDEGEDIRESAVEKKYRRNQNCGTNESSVDLVIITWPHYTVFRLCICMTWPRHLTRSIQRAQIMLFAPAF